MENFTIHIFGYGETQINTSNSSIKVATDTLTSVTPLIQAIFNLKPADNNSGIDDYHAINIFGYIDIRWMTKTADVKGFNIKDNNLTVMIDNLITELDSINLAK